MINQWVKFSQKLKTGNRPGSERVNQGTWMLTVFKILLIANLEHL